MGRVVAALAVVLSASAVAAIPACADGSAGVLGKPNNIAAAVGSGVRGGVIVGFTASGPDVGAAATAVIAACHRAGADQCTSDEVTNDRLCIVNVHAPASGVVAGGAGPTIEDARRDAFNRAAANNTPLAADSPTLASSCP
ncbi:hypothetical protein A5630_27550 [Mycolicibacterium mucogenicum]|uniref:DUF4189 domain-containing protein n=1 Tax=Mycolicibacterium mucogenicum TaxID=56689 RepID=A0A1A3GVC4_MYCMU|nr:hypothetical protein [Mycolicibacterium mucogenicum]OBJ39294.1 hypothetical protein A5630_27550 [Mycolicibacterium mucogenicum]